MSRRDEQVTVGPVKLRARTEAAWGIEHPGSDRIVWFAKSISEIDDEDAKVGDMVTLNVPKWKAKAEGLD